jgi:hypothetical protein
MAQGGLDSTDFAPQEARSFWTRNVADPPETARLAASSVMQARS